MEIEQLNRVIMEAAKQKGTDGMTQGFLKHWLFRTNEMLGINKKELIKIKIESIEVETDIHIKGLHTSIRFLKGAGYLLESLDDIMIKQPYSSKPNEDIITALESTSECSNVDLSTFTSGVFTNTKKGEEIQFSSGHRSTNKKETDESLDE